MKLQTRNLVRKFCILIIKSFFNIWFATLKYFRKISENIEADYLARSSSDIRGLILNCLKKYQFRFKNEIHPFLFKNVKIYFFFFKLFFADRYSLIWNVLLNCKLYFDLFIFHVLVWRFVIKVPISLFLSFRLKVLSFLNS